MNQLAADIGYAIGTLIALGLFIGGGFLLANRLSKGREPGAAVRWPIYAGFAIAALSLVNQCSKMGNSLPTPEAKVTVRVTKNPAPANAVLLRLDPAKEATLKKALVDGATAGLTKAGQSTNGINAEVSYLGGKDVKLSVATVKTNDGTIESHIVALERGDQVEITCIPDESLRRSFKPSDLQCGQKVTEVLGAPALALLES